MAKRTGKYHDWGKTTKQFSYALLDAGREMTNDVKRDFAYLAEECLTEMDAKWPHNTEVKKNGKTRRFGGDHDHPWFYGQLHDSMAIRIAEKNKTVAVRYMPPSPATTEKQHMSEGGLKIDNIDGKEWGKMVAEQRAPYYFLPGIQVQLIAGVPYAEKVNESSRHAGFFENLSVELINKYDNFMLTGSSIKHTTYIADGSSKVKRKRGIR